MLASILFALPETQAVSVPAASPLSQAVVGGIVILTQLGTVWVAHLKGKRGAKLTNEGLDQRFAKLSATMADHIKDFRMALDLHKDEDREEFGKIALGITGCQAAIEHVKTSVDGIAKRELDRLETDAAQGRRRNR